ncbi:MAG: elongation factor G [Planctomycetota bacterium]|jgi:elongation factor G
MAGKDTRNIAFVGHGGAGKTSLCEAFLFAAKAVNRQGTVGDKNTVSDFTEDEKERGHSIEIGVMHCDWKGKYFQLLDAPGYPDFQGQAIRALDGADLAVVVVNAYDGVGLNARKLYRAAERAGVPRIIVVNRCDLDNIDESKVGKGIADLAGVAAKPVTIPDQLGSGFSAVQSIFGEASEYKEGFIEAAVEADDELMEKYLESGEVSDDDLNRAIPLALQAGTLVPVFHTSAEKQIGVTELMDFIAQHGPSPVGRDIPDMDENHFKCEPNDPFLGFCFKVMFDRQAGKIAFIRVFRGGVKAGDQIKTDRDKTIKIGHLARYQGHTKEDVDGAGIGDIVAIPKAEDIEIGDCLYAPDAPLKFRPRHIPASMVALALTPKSRGDETKIGKELVRVTGADPCLIAERTSDTNELVLRGLSTLHTDIALKRLSAAGVEVDTHIPKIAYLETITGKAEGHYRHKKQTGGAGQFGEIFLRIEPQERNSEDALDFVDETVGGSVPKQFLSATEKGVRQQMADGVLAGCKFVDVRVTVYDGKTHDVDSKEIAFIICGRRAFSDAVKKAKPVLLEPMVHVDIEVPSQYMGDINSDLNSRRARIEGMDSAGDMQILHARAPLAEMQTYSTQLRSITGGEGSYSMDLAGYDVVPGNIAQQIMAKYEAEKKEEE